MTATIGKILEISTICNLSENDILKEIKHPSDENADWLNHDTYIIYFAIGQLFRPESILEIGTRYGYSLESLSKGSERVKHIFSFDSEYDFIGSQEYVHNKFLNRDMETLNFKVCNTRLIFDFELPFEIDLAHVDAEHSYNGTYQDTSMAFNYVKHGGIILVDDIENEEVKKGAEQFCEEQKQPFEYLPCYRGMYVITVNKG